MRAPLTRPALTAAALALGLTALTACTDSGDEPEATATFAKAAAPSVALDTADGLDATVTIGLVVSGTSPRGEGAEDLGLAAGARVADYRLDLGADDPRVELEVIDDRGTSAGAVAAVESLQQSGAAGIVYASEGSHLDAALVSAAKAGIAVLLPYDSRAIPAAATTTFRTGPSDAQAAKALAAVLDARGLDTPYSLAGEGVAPQLAGLAAPARRGLLVAGGALLQQAQRAGEAIREKRADAIVLSASAASQAEAVAALQEYDAGATLVLAPTALSPVFAARLAGLGAQGTATTAGEYLTVGTAATDTSTSTPVAAFLAAVRLAAQDSETASLLGARGFAEDGAAVADTRSHDAVVSLVKAAATAASAGAVDKAAVLTALRGLTVTTEDGLAGPDLAFGTQQALADADVVVLQATRRDPGLRGDLAGLPALTWFAVPDGATQSAG